MAEEKRAAPGFWVLWSCGVLLLATVVWLGLRFAAAYRDCDSRRSCGTMALRAALFLELPPRQAANDNRFVKYLIKPPAPDAERENAPCGDASAPQGPDPELPARLAEEAARNAAIQGLLRAARDAGPVLDDVQP